MSDDEYEIPLVDQRYFGAGIKRKRIHFVQSTQPEQNSAKRPRQTELSAADKYLSIVLGEKKRNDEEGSAAKVIETDDGHGSPQREPVVDDVPAVTDRTTCELCGGPLGAADLSRRHDLSIVHQICLKHSHPPSHINRSSKALAVLQSQGWDPDSRRGLGAAGEGILHPLKAQDNPQRVGLGAVLAEIQAKPKPVKLDAGKVRKLEQQTRRQKDKLREMFYRSEDIDKYLGDK